MRKDMFQVCICTERSMRRYIEFGDIRAQNHVSLIVSLDLVDVVCLRGRLDP